MPIAMGYLVPEDGADLSKYKLFSLVMIICSMLGTFLALFVFAYDLSHTGVLYAKDPKAYKCYIDYWTP
jgi:hypothetical protein